MSIKKLLSSFLNKKTSISDNNSEFNSLENPNLGNSPDVPEIVRRFRKSYANQNEKALVKLYFELLNKMHEDIKSKNYNSMIANGQISLGLLETLIRYWKNSYGEFDIKTIPAIDYVLPHYAVRGNI